MESPGIESTPWFWISLFAILATGFALPIVIALVRRVERMWMVVLLTIVGLCTCIAWPSAMIAARLLPGHPRQPSGHNAQAGRLVR